MCRLSVLDNTYYCMLSLSCDIVRVTDSNAASLTLARAWHLPSLNMQSIYLSQILSSIFAPLCVCVPSSYKLIHSLPCSRLSFEQARLGKLSLISSPNNMTLTALLTVSHHVDPNGKAYLVSS